MGSIYTLKDENEQFGSQEIKTFFFYHLSETSELHSHKFYEIFLVFEGSCIHCINGQRHLIKKGDLVFMRPSDIHCYEDNGDICHLVNLSFSDAVFEDLKVFFKYTNKLNAFFASPLPWTCHLKNTARINLLNKFKKLHTMHFENLTMKKIHTRVLLANIFYDYFILEDENKLLNNSAPEWLKDIYSELTSIDVYTTEFNQVLEKSGKSREHISRCFKKYTGKTIVDYINTQRINYACNLLVNTDMKIIDISMQCGFESLSVFYSLFNKHLDMSPKKFRDTNISGE